MDSGRNFLKIRCVKLVKDFIVFCNVSITCSVADVMDPISEAGEIDIKNEPPSPVMEIKIEPQVSLTLSRNFCY